MHIKINMNTALAGLAITNPIAAFREAMRDFRAFYKKNDLSGSNSALKRAHEAAQRVLADGGKLPSTYADEVAQYGLDKKKFKEPFKIKAVKPARIRKREFASKEKAAPAGKTTQRTAVENQIAQLREERDNLVKGYEARIQKLLDSINPLKAK